MTALSEEQNTRRIAGFNEGKEVKAYGYYAYAASGALRATPRDMLTYGEAMLGAANANGRTVPRPLADAMREVQAPDFKIARPGEPVWQGMAWERHLYDPSVVSDGLDAVPAASMTVKNGETSGFVSAIAIDAESRVVVFAAANAHGDEIQQLVLAIARALHKAGIAVPADRRDAVINVD